MKRWQQWSVSGVVHGAIFRRQTGWNIRAMAYETVCCAYDPLADLRPLQPLNWSNAVVGRTSLAPVTRPASPEERHKYRRGNPRHADHDDSDGEVVATHRPWMGWMPGDHAYTTSLLGNCRSRCSVQPVDRRKSLGIVASRKPIRRQTYAVVCEVRASKNIFERILARDTP